jgi:lysophospholipase L1-like esterase
MFVDATRAIANEYGTGYIDLYIAIRGSGDATLVSEDSLHPSNTGHAFIAQLVNNYVRTMIPAGNSGL